MKGLKFSHCGYFLLGAVSRTGWLRAQRRCSRPVPAPGFHGDSSGEKACTGDQKKKVGVLFQCRQVQSSDWQRRQRLGPAGTPEEPRNAGPL